MLQRHSAAKGDQAAYQVAQCDVDICSVEESLQSFSTLMNCYADVDGELDCPDNLFRVLLGNYFFFKGGMRADAFPPGESECNPTPVSRTSAYR